VGHEEAGEIARRVEVEGALTIERRDHGGEHTAEASGHHHQRNEPGAAPPLTSRRARYEAAAAGDGRSSSRANALYSSPVSTQSSNWITPISVNLSRSQPSAASSSPSFLQFGTI